jgi:SSS family solute:Na+ symporter
MLLNRASLLACALLSIAVGRAENLVTVQTEALLALPKGLAITCMVAADQPLVVGDGAVWRLEIARHEWTRTNWHPSSGVILGAIANGAHPLFLIGAKEGGPVERVEAFSFAVGAIVSATLPPLPAPITNARGAVLDGVLYLSGITAKQTPGWWSINLVAPQPAWKPLHAWSATSRFISSVVAQDSALYLTVTESTNTGDEVWRWTTSDGWLRKAILPGAVVEGAARAIGQAHILYLLQPVGGAKGVAAGQLLTFHTITASIATQGAANAAGAQHGSAWGNGLIWESTSSGGAVATLWLSQILGSKLLLRPLDWVMIVTYLAGIACIGIYCYRREKKQSTAEFFVGSRTIPFWAAGISLYATNSSSIGYIATPAKAFATNWQYLLNNLIGVLGLMFVAVWIVPLLRRLDMMSVFHYLDKRFHLSVRLAASALCIVMHLGGRMSVILFLPALAISTITGLNVVYSILIMGFVTIGYTTLGGMRAVIWTDCAQFIVKFGGLFFALGYIIYRLAGGWGEFVATAVADNKMHMFDWSFDLTKATVWGFIVLVLFETVLTFPKDQILMQRVFTTKSAKEAGRSVWLFAALIIPGSFMFYLIGTGLYVFYHSHPERMNPLLSVDATFPLFIAAELPAGVTGLMIAGLFSAAMATLSSILNSVATMISVDFYEKLARKPDPAVSIRLAEWVTVIAGLIGIGLALLLSRLNISSFLDVAIEFAGLFGGSFGGAYTLGMFTRRANWQGVLIGMVVSFIATFAVWSVNLVHPFLYLAFSICVSIVVGYAASYFFPPPTIESLRGLTVFTPKENATTAAA